MDVSFGEWYRTANFEPDDKLLRKRWKGVESFSKNITALKILDLARLFYTLLPKDEDFQNEFRTAFFEADNAFKMQGNDLELSVLAGVTLACVLNGKDNTLGDVAAFAAVCPRLQGRGKTATIPDIQNRARSYLVQRSAGLRASAGINGKHIPVPQMDESLRAISEACSANAVTNLAAPVTELFKKLGMATQKVIQSTNQIQRNQLLYREESDMLWWLQGKYSRDLEVPIGEIGLPAASIVVGKEMADLTKVLPGPFAARAILHEILLGEGSDAESEVSLSLAINKTDREWRLSWAQNFGNSDALDLCPISFAATKSLETDSARGWLAPFKKATRLSASVKIEPIEIAMQVYEEGLFVKAFNKSLRGK